MSTPSRDVLFQNLRGLLGDAFALHQKGGAGARLGRSYGMADGYMRALLDLGLATQKELTRLVAEERTNRLGPATQALAADAQGESAETIAA